MKIWLAGHLMSLGLRLVRKSIYLSGLGNEIEILIVPKTPLMYSPEMFGYGQMETIEPKTPPKHLH